MEKKGIAKFPDVLRDLITGKLQRLKKPTNEEMEQNIKVIDAGAEKQKWIGGIRLIFILCIVWIHSGCIPKVNIPVVDHFNVKTNMWSGNVDVGTHEEQLLSDLYILIKANEGLKVPICGASKESKQCIKNGVTFFVQGGVIPGIGKRKYYGFSNISLSEKRLDFTKDNSSTTFIGTPMYTKENNCQVYVKNGGLQVEMTKYYANWAGIGNMTMAEGWAIDYIDLNKGTVGLQLELAISGPFVLGGGSKYVLLKFPNVPDILSQSESKYN